MDGWGVSGYRGISGWLRGIKGVPTVFVLGVAGHGDGLVSAWQDVKEES